MVRVCPNGTRDKFQCIVSLVPVCVLSWCVLSWCVLSWCLAGVPKLVGVAGVRGGEFG